MAQLSTPLLDALHAVNAKLINEIDGPNRTQLQFWAVPRPGVVVAQLFPNDSVEIYRPLTESNSIGVLLETLRAYIASEDEAPAAWSELAPPAREIVRLQAELDAAKLRIRELVREYGNTTEGRDWTWHDKPDDIARAMLLTHTNKAEQLGAALQNLAKPPNIVST